MCSIAGSKNKDEVFRMLDIMKHRAPDGFGVVDNSNYAIGMGRLAIIDLKSDGLCPYSEGDLTLSFNGEIYNYIELKRELENLGHKFRTNSDIEVCLKSYIEWGVDCLKKFNGMFAFAILDKDKVFLARDIAGEKPLYYSLSNFHFASEGKAMTGLFRELMPAHYMIHYFDGRENEIHKYWELEKIEIKDPEKELEVLLEDAIKIRTRSDVPYGLYYSGGVDSALIATFHNFKYKFTYEDGDYSKEFFNKISKIVYHLDAPVSSFSAFGLYKLAERASKKVKVVLSGEGADELFGGYVRYVQPHFNWLAQKKFPSYKSMFGNALNVSDYGWKEFNGNQGDI